MKNDFEKIMEGKVSPENKKELLKQAVETLPTEFLCIDADVPFTSLDDADLRLKELTSKVMQALHVKVGDAVVMGQPEATTEESQEFASLLKEKGSNYSKFALLLDSVADTENDPDKYLVDTSSLENDTKENIKKAIEILPTEILCINADVPFTSLDDADLRLKELVPKVMQTLHVKAGHAVVVGQPEASTEESQEFANLLREKGSGYSKFASLLESIEQKGNAENKLTPLEQVKKVEQVVEKEREPKGVKLAEERWGNISNFAANLIQFQEEMQSNVWGEFNGEIIELDGSGLTSVGQVVKKYNELKEEKRKKWAEEEAGQKAKEGGN